MLASIMAERRADVEAARQDVPLEQLRALAARRTHHGLARRLASPGTSIIAEVKKGSPSAGTLRENYDPAAIASSYRDAGAAGISVLTEPRHFSGTLEHLRGVRNAVDLPVLRKDFICDSYQLYESAAWGADVILLIVAALSERDIRCLYDEAAQLGLEVLVESHNAAELRTALACRNAMIGVNSRDLVTLKTDLAIPRALAAQIPADRISVAESGIGTNDDIRQLEQLGYNGFLVGTTLMRSADPGAELGKLMGTA